MEPLPSASPALGATVDALAVALLATGLLSVAQRRLDVAIWLVGLQSLVLAATAAAIALATGEAHVYLAVVLTLAVKVVAIPAVLFWVLGRVKVRREVELVLPLKAALVVAVGLVLVAYYAAGELHLPGAVPSRHALPVSLALVLIGLFLMIGRRKALSQVVGLVTMENGIYLAALVATLGLPVAVELGVFFDLFVGVLLLGVVTHRISQTFDSINVDQLRHLRG